MSVGSVKRKIQDLEDKLKKLRKLEKQEAIVNKQTNDVFNDTYFSDVLTAFKIFFANAEMSVTPLGDVSRNFFTIKSGHYNVYLCERGKPMLFIHKQGEMHLPVRMWHSFVKIDEQNNYIENADRCVLMNLIAEIADWDVKDDLPTHMCYLSQLFYGMLKTYVMVWMNNSNNIKKTSRSMYNVLSNLNTATNKLNNN